MEENEKKQINPKTQNRSNKTVNYALMPSREDIAFIETITAQKVEEEETSIIEQDAKEALVYSNDVTSIDFMMPEEERKIIEQSLNVYDDQKKVQEVLAIAKKNKKIREDIKNLDFISKEGKLGDQLLNVMTSEESIRVLLQSFHEKMEKGESGKAYKELATAYKIISDARQEKIKQLNAQKTGRSARIIAQFKNDNGEEIQIGAEF